MGCLIFIWCLRDCLFIEYGEEQIDTQILALVSNPHSPAEGGNKKTHVKVLADHVK